MIRIKTMDYEVYTYFGRVLKTFTVPSNETHHNTKMKARLYLMNKEEQGVICWIRLKH